jgi:hypothetical protein
VIPRIIRAAIPGRGGGIALTRRATNNGIDALKRWSEPTEISASKALVDLSLQNRHPGMVEPVRLGGVTFPLDCESNPKACFLESGPHTTGAGEQIHSDWPASVDGYRSPAARTE